MFRRIADSALFALSMIAVLLAASWPPAGIRAAVSPPPQPNTATQPPVQPAATTHLYLPFMRTSIGAPQFLISNPAAGSTIAGTSLVVAQPILGPSVSSVKFTAGNKTLGIDNTPADGFQAFIDAKQFPAGALKITATATGPEGGQAKSVDVTVQPSPPSSATVGASGTTLGTASGATIVIPPGAVSGNANVSLRERNQAQVTAESGIKWDDIGVTFLGDIQVQSSTPLQKPVDISTVGYSNRVQPGQTVVTYNMLPDQDGDGVGELVVASGATVAPNGAIVSTPLNSLVVKNISIGTQTQGQISMVEANTLSGSPGKSLALQGSGFNIASLRGNIISFRSEVNGTVFDMPASISLDPLQLGEQRLKTIIPPLPLGLAKVTVQNQSTGATLPPFTIQITNAPTLVKPAPTVIKEFLANTIAYFQNIPTSSPEEAAALSKGIAKLTKAQADFDQLISSGITPEVGQALNQVAITIANADIYSASSIKTFSVSPAGYDKDAAAGDILGFAGSVAAVIQGVDAAVAGATILGAIGIGLTIGIGILGAAYFGCRFIRGGNCFGDPPPPCSSLLSKTSDLNAAAGEQCTIPPPCQPTANGGSSTSRGVGGAPPPGGNGCGNVSNGGGNGAIMGASPQAATSSLTPGRYIIKVFPQSGGKALSPFTGATDAGGYFFLPFIPKGEPFRAVAVDTVTGASQTFDGVGPDIGKSVYMFFDFSNAQSNSFPINVGDTVSDGVPSPGAGNIETLGGIDVYTFNATAGQTVYFQEITGDCLSQFTWKLTDSGGATVFDQALGGTGCGADAGKYTLSTGGAYRLTVSAKGSNTGTYSFKLWNVPAPQQFAIAIGDAVSNGVPAAGAGNIETPGVQDIYTFTAAAGQTVYFGELTGDCLTSLDWRLVAPNNAEVFNQTLGGTSCGADAGKFTLTQAGTYTLIVGGHTGGSGLGSGRATGTYSFQLWNVPASQQFSIVIGNVVSNGVPAAGAGNIETPGVQDIYTFTAAAGQTVYFGELTGDCLTSLDWRLVAPNNAEVFNQTLGGTGCGADAGKFTLTQAGTYTLIVGGHTGGSGLGSGRATGTYSFQLWNVPASQQFSIVIGNVVSNGVPAAGAGNIETPGVQDIYTFTAAAGQTVYFGELTGDCLTSLDWRLVAPNNAELFNQTLGGTGCGADAGKFTLTQAGTYTLIVGSHTGGSGLGSGRATGTYSFQLWNVPVPQQFSIMIGNTVSNGVPAAGAGNIETPGVQDIYTFTAAAGQVVSFDELTGDCLSSLDWRLAAPNGAELFNQTLGGTGCGTSVGSITLTQAGTYTITVGSHTGGSGLGAGRATGTYSFRLQ